MFVALCGGGADDVTCADCTVWVRLTLLLLLAVKSQSQLHRTEIFFSSQQRARHEVELHPPATLSSTNSTPTPAQQHPPFFDLTSFFEIFRKLESPYWMPEPIFSGSSCPDRVVCA
jgi:hypothetical protein